MRSYDLLQSGWGAQRVLPASAVTQILSASNIQYAAAVPYFVVGSVEPLPCPPQSSALGPEDPL